MRLGRKGIVVLVVVALVAAGGIVAGLLLTRGSGGSGKLAYPYPESAKSLLLSACMKKGNSGYCGCVVRAYQNTIPYDTYKAILLGGVTATSTSFARWSAFQTQSAHCQL
ncbi:MAG TPA: hypothetical protein VLJ76_02910 [Gaiellaceae bacterium]|nr:hypothetical protein [Gaiellaceae bacterium]